MNKLILEQRADPYAIRFGNMYYFTASVPEYDRIELRRAESLEALASAEPAVVWRKHESGPMGAHIWAPELHSLDGVWYIYFAAGDAEDIWRIRPYALRCEGSDPLQGPWTECGMLQSADGDAFSFTEFSLDATVFRCNGHRYLVWAEKVNGPGGISNLYIAEMETPTRLKTAQVLLTTPDYGWERVVHWVNEGPAVLQHKGRVFITYSASATGAEYCMGMLEADAASDLLDPLSWRKSRTPVLQTSPRHGIYGPGHNSFTQLPDGTPATLFHARATAEIKGDPLSDPGRHTHLMRMEFDAEDRPVFRLDG